MMAPICEQGIVIETHEGIATVRMDRSSACARCKSGCIERGGSMVTEAENSAGAQEGDAVGLEFNSRAAITAAAIVFGIPLLALFLGVILTTVAVDRMGYEDHNQLLSLGAGAILFVLAFIPVRIYDRRIRRSGRHAVRVVEILKKKHEYM